MEQKIYFQNSKGDKLCGILSNPTGDTTKPIIILVHGFSANKDARSLRLIKELIDKKGISTFRFDIYGHGESDGKLEDITISEGVDDVLQAINFLKQRDYKKIGLVGTSFGGICCTVASVNTKDLFVMVLKSPVSDFKELIDLKYSKEEIKNWEQKGHIFLKDGEKKLKINYLFYNDFGNNNGYFSAPNIKSPTLIVHGDKDEEVPDYQSVKLSRLIPNCKLITIKGADHGYRKPEHMKEMLEAIANFIFEIIENNK